MPLDPGVGPGSPANCDCRRVRLGVVVRGVGETGQILRLPSGTGDGGHVARRGQAERARTVHQPGHLLGVHRTALQPGRADDLVEVLDLGVQRGEFGVDGLGQDLAQHRRGALDGAVHHSPGLHLDAQVDLFLRHRAAHQLLLLADQVVVERERARDVVGAADGVVDVRLGPHPDRVRPVRHAQVQPAAL